MGAAGSRRGVGLQIDLVQQADQLTLTPFGTLGASQTMLSASESDVTEWRVVELYSEVEEPFAAELSWTGADGAGQNCRLTVTNHARCCIAAKAITGIKCTNLAAVKNLVRAAIATVGSSTTTENHWLFKGSPGGIAGTISTAPPPYAESVVIGCSLFASRVGSTVNLYDGVGALIDTFPLNLQPAYTPVSGVALVEVVGVPGTLYRFDFRLGI